MNCVKMNYLKMNYLITIGSQFKTYNEGELALAINPDIEWQIISIDANPLLFKESHCPNIWRMRIPFEEADILEYFKPHIDTNIASIYVYDLISCGGMFKPALNLIKFIYSLNKEYNIYYRHGNTLYSEHPEEFTLVNEDIIKNYLEFKDNPKLANGILKLFAAKKELSKRTKRPVSYEFINQIWQMKSLPKEPFNIDQFINYLANLELLNIADTFIKVENGELSDPQIKKICNCIYGVVGDYSALIH